MTQLKNIRVYWQKFRYILTVPLKRWGIVLLILTLIGAVVETLGISVILPLVQVMMTPDVIRQYEFVQKILNILHLSSDKELIWLVGFFAIFVYIFKNLYLLFLTYVRTKYACKVQRELAVEMMESYMGRGYPFFLNTNTSELLRGMGESIANTYQALYHALKLLAEALTVTCICIYILWTDIMMALAVGVLIVLCLGIVILGFRKWAKRCGEINYKYAAETNKVLLQVFHGIKEVLVMHRQQYFVDRYQEKYIKRQKGIIGQALASESPTYIIEAMCVTGLIIAVCIRIAFSVDTAIFIPQLAAFAVAAFRILPSLGRISINVNQFMFCIPGINDTYNNFKKVREHRTTVDKKVVEIQEHRQEIKFTENLCLKDVSWCYPGSDKQILDHINITIERGESVAFVGASGAGKTTLSDIILGLLIPQNGAVLVDGIDIQKIPEQWAYMIGFVPQNAFLMDDTIRSNVAFGIGEKEINDEMVWKALEQAQLKSFVEELPKGLDTLIGERGVRFSGGQRQRVVIARALYFNPDILVLDEATSALDTETETAVMESIEALQGHKTLIIIAHRLTTIRNCDTIYRIEDGGAKQCRYEELS